MEVLLMAVVLDALCLHQGLQGAAISSIENGTYTNRSEDLKEKNGLQGAAISSIENGTYTNRSEDLKEKNDRQDEDAVVVCSGSSYRPATTVNTFMTNFTNCTTETVTEVVAEDSHDRISAPVLGCIALSVTLFLLLVLNAQCAYRKRRNGGTETIRPSQVSQRGNSDTSSESDFERYYNPDPPPTTVNNNEHSHALDSESTSSGECYEITETEMENLLNPAVNQFYPEHCIQMTPLQNTSEPAKIDSSDSSDSDSTCSGECYENTAEVCLQTLEGDPMLPEQPPLSHPKPQMAGNSSVSQPYSTVQVVNQFYPEHCIQMTPLHNTSEPAKIDSSDSFDSDSTCSGECYENTGVNAGAGLQTLEGEQLFPEQPPLSHPPQPYSTVQDDSSTSSEEAYENVAEIEGIYFARSERSVHSSSDSDYDDVANW
ncbi:hypothetical protein AMELA_G00076940 [Ameiurus melas]|uniref:Uncharacterized protein n=1 Tax=Ameiurus melas TaxID=219545 RepID=A0A7J6B0S5_AMEME|nr:hypothetical protein AMELA_G00076940 [Ameiurus melas]